MDPHVNSCASCPCGRASAVGRGGPCPFVARQRQRGEFVYIEGEAAATVWFVKRGTIVLTRSEREGVETPRAVRRAGAFLGLEALVRSSYLDTARALSPATLCGASREVVDAWLGAPTSPARTALEQTLRALCDDVPRSAGADGTALRRVARWILASDAEQPLPRRYTARLLGMVPETFSRALAGLRGSGAIAVTRTMIRVLDAEALRRAAG